MKNRPTKEKVFIDNAVAEKADITNQKEDLHQYVKKRTKWPLDDTPISPSMAEGSHLRKNINLTFKEFEWNSIDRHTKAIGISKTDWIRYAVFKQLQEEQIMFLKEKNKD